MMEIIFYHYNIKWIISAKKINLIPLNIQVGFQMTRKVKQPVVAIKTLREETQEIVHHPYQLA